MKHVVIACSFVAWPLLACSSEQSAGPADTVATATDAPDIASDTSTASDTAAASDAVGETSEAATDAATVAETTPGDSSADTPSDTTPTPIHISGLAQKGPFQTGASVTIRRLATDGQDVGQVVGAPVETTVASDLGAFTADVPGPGLYRIEVSGHWFNELYPDSGVETTSLIALAMFTADGPHTANVNVVTHMSAARVLALVAGGASFDAATEQAERELRGELGVVPVSFVNAGRGVTLDLLGGDTDANAYLLATSLAVIDGAPYLGGDVQSFVDQVAADLAEHGTLTEADKNAAFGGILDFDIAPALAALTAYAHDHGSNAAAPDIARILDQDRDGVLNPDDNCPRMANPGQDDGDHDGVGDECDNCRETPNADQADENQNTIGDACDLCGGDPYCKCYANDDSYCSALGKCVGEMCVAFGARAVGESCTVATSGSEDCARGAFCMIPADGKDGVCVALPTYDEAGTHCPEGTTSEPLMGAPGEVCAAVCDPAAPVCAPKQSCYPQKLHITGGLNHATWAGTGFVCAYDYASVNPLGSGGRLSPCGIANECAPEFSCVTSQSECPADQGSTCCLTTCTNASGCESGEQCSNQLHEAPHAGGATTYYGACLTP